MAVPGHETGLLHDTNAWLAASFIIFCIVLWKMGKNKIIQALDARIANIKNEIETAQNLRDEAEALLEQYKAKKEAAEKEAAHILEEAKKSAYNIKNSAERELKESLKRKEKQLEDRIKRIQQEAMNEIQAYAADLAIKTTREIIAENLDAKANEKLIDAAIADIRQTH